MLIREDDSTYAAPVIVVHESHQMSEVLDLADRLLVVLYRYLSSLDILLAAVNYPGGYVDARSSASAAQCICVPTQAESIARLWG